MKLLRAICRFVFGLTFIFSGFLKFIDPVGTGLLIKEYLTIFHLGFLDFSSIFVGVLLSSLEFIIGVSILLGLRIKIASKIALFFISFFTILTLYLALFNPISDCGCFGEAIHLTNWETFLKNIVLFLCSLLIYVQRDKFIPIAPKYIEWTFVIIYWFIAVFIAVQTIITLPHSDFTAFKVGTDLKELKNTEEVHYETVFIYSKDGKNSEFDLEELPDSTWQYIESKTKLISGSTENAGIDLAISDKNGKYCTEILYKDTSLVAAIVYDMGKTSKKTWKRISDLDKELNKNGRKIIVITSTSAENIPDSLNYNFLFSDYKTLLTLNRSNGGVVYFDKGYVIRKWPSINLPVNQINNILSEDSEVILLKSSIKEKLFINISLGTIIFLIMMMRYICRISYKHKKPKTTSNLQNIL
ncbi:MAG: DoxX family protein [Bacteroidales bacterium]|nr:DoxX family protein [Bacteroidales bacterium]